MSFKNKNNIVLEIRDNLIDIIVGNESKIDFTGSLNIENGICEDGYIKDLEKLTSILNIYFLKNGIKEKDISFLVFGSDVITRNIEVPYMKGRSLKKTIEFEINDVIGSRDQYYIDYEIIQEVKNDFGKIIRYEVLIAGCSKKKIDLLVKLAEKLEKNLNIIDVLTNSLNKILINNKIIDYYGKNVGLIFFGYNFSNISIANNGVLKLERTIPFGFENIVREMKTIIEVEKGRELSLDEIKKEIKHKSNRIQELFENYPRIKDITNQFIELIYKTIQFYSAGKGDKSIDKLAIISKVELNNSIIDYIEEYFNVNSTYIRSTRDLGIKVKCSENKISKYLSLYGIFLRR